MIVFKTKSIYAFSFSSKDEFLHKNKEKNNLNEMISVLFFPEILISFSKYNS